MQGPQSAEDKRPLIGATLLHEIPKRKIRRELLELGAAYPHTQVIKTILFHSNFPVDIRHNSKIFREKLTIWARKQLG